MNFGKHYGKILSTTDGLLYLFSDCKLIWNEQRIPLCTDPRLLGQLCGLLTGHANLQLHRYRLGLTFSPTCICLGGDESPQHFLFECETYREIREKFPPSLNNWNSIIYYLKISLRNPQPSASYFFFFACLHLVTDRKSHCLWHFLALILGSLSDKQQIV